MAKQVSGRFIVGGALRSAAAAFLLLATAPSATGQGSEALVWARANNCATIRAYLNQFPSGTYAREARAALSAKNCPDPEADARRRAAAEAAERVRLENETRDLRDRLAREEAARRAAETRAADEARKRVAAESAAQQKATQAPAATQSSAYDLNLLNPEVRRAVESARAAKSRASLNAVRARQVAQQAEASARVSPRDGLGIFGSTSANFVGDRYAGNFVAGNYSGDGVYSWAQNPNNGVGMLRYEGTFSGGAPADHGTFYWRSGQIYHGQVNGWRRSGYGVQVQTDSRRYEGQFGSTNGAEDGIGVMWTASGAVQGQGYWTNGTLTRPYYR